jgi:hypothetical protein
MNQIDFDCYSVFYLQQQQGASTSVFVATAYELDGVSGYYFNNCFQSSPADEALKPDTARKLCAISGEMVTKAKTLQKDFV